MKVKYSYLPEQFKVEGKEVGQILEDIKGLLKTGQFTLGPPLERFEARFATLCKTGYALGVNSGTDALFLTLKALNIGKGDEVITAPNSFVSTAAAIAHTGAKPVFVDVNEEYNINPELIESTITPNTKAIVPVDLTGNPANLPKIQEIAEKHNLYLIEDACQAVGASIDGRPVGSFGTAGCFSLHPLKNLNVWGDGGVIATNSKELAGKLMLLRNHGLRTREECDFFGHNSRLDTLQAIVANRLLDILDSITEARIQNARRYDAGLAELVPFITIPPRKDNVREVFHTYTIQAKERDKLFKFLEQNEIEPKIHYPIPIHLQQAAAYLGYKAGDFPVCETQARSIITLPVHQHLRLESIDYVIDTIKRYYKK